jgi:flagellar biogenesis protein FliO
MHYFALLQTSPGTVGGPDLTQYFAVCVGLIAAIVIGGFAIKRLFKHTLTARAARRSLRIVDVLPLGGKQRLAVVSCYERTFIVGLGDKELCLVAELDAQATPELTAAGATPLPLPADQNAFQRLLGAVRPRAPKSAAPTRVSERGLSSEGVLG